MIHKFELTISQSAAVNTSVPIRGYLESLQYVPAGTAITSTAVLAITTLGPAATLGSSQKIFNAPVGSAEVVWNPRFKICTSGGETVGTSGLFGHCRMPIAYELLKATVSGSATSAVARTGTLRIWVDGTIGG